MKVIAMIAAVTVLLLVSASAVSLSNRIRHDRTADTIRHRLTTGSETAGHDVVGSPVVRASRAAFDVAMLDGLPEAAQRWIAHVIESGTPLAASVELEMRGTLRLDEGEPWRMTAQQVIAPPRGFIWRARASRGPVMIRGFDRYIDGAGEMRWWLWGIVPVMSGRGADISRSAAGRLAGEAVLLPSSLLAAAGVSWEAVDEDVARVTITIHDEPVTLTLEVAEDGRLRRVVIRRWNSDPANGDVGYLPFVVDFDGERSVGGYRVPQRIRAGWQRGDAARPFFDADLTVVRFD